MDSATPKANLNWLLALVFAVPAIAFLVWLGLVRQEIKLAKETRKKME
jgi:hypothetical protein